MVEDDEAIRETIRQTLSIEGYEVVTAGNGEVALEVLAAGLKPAVALVDLRMPRMDGRTFLAETRKHDQFREIPVVLLSAASDLKSEAAETGPDAFLAKPFDVESLLDVVKGLSEGPSSAVAI